MGPDALKKTKSLLDKGVFLGFDYGSLEKRMLEREAAETAETAKEARFQQHLEDLFGDRVESFSPELRDTLKRLYTAGLVDGEHGAKGPGLRNTQEERDHLTNVLVKTLSKGGFWMTREE